LHPLSKQFANLNTNQTPSSDSSCVPKSGKSIGHELDAQPNQHRNK